MPNPTQCVANPRFDQMPVASGARFKSCRLAAISRSLDGDCRCRPGQETLCRRMRKFAHAHPRFGYRRVHIMLEGLGSESEARAPSQAGEPPSRDLTGSSLLPMSAEAGVLSLMR